MKKVLAAFFFLGLAPAVPVAACPDGAVLQRLTDMGNLYIGEMHGTQESPAFLACLVAYEIAHGVKPLTVSVEFENAARDMQSPVWRANDGRTSVAMAATLQWLVGEEAKGHVRLHFQRGDGVPFDRIERTYGEGIRAQAAAGRVIAYSGNIHARKTISAFSPALPAGTYVGPGFTHIDVESVDKGTAWVNINGDTGVHALVGSHPDEKPGTLVPSNDDAYDFVYLVPAFTASLPHLPGQLPPAGKVSP
ncbi:MAG: hypothetical protein ABWX83_15965 [Luteibacter sp.]